MSTKKAAGVKAPALPKPDFGSPGGIVDPAYFPQALRDELVAIATQRHSLADAERFVASCGELAQMILGSRPGLTYGGQREQLQLIADRARDLLRAMQRLGTDAVEHMAAHETHPTSGSEDSPVQWSKFVRETVRARWPRDGLLSCSWDFVEALEATAAHAAGHVARTNASPDVHTSAGLARDLVRLYVRHFGKLPPSDKSGWFVAFMQRIGEHVGLECGPRPVAEAIKQETPTR